MVILVTTQHTGGTNTTKFAAQGSATIGKTNNLNTNYYNGQLKN